MWNNQNYSNFGRKLSLLLGRHRSKLIEKMCFPAFKWGSGAQNKLVHTTCRPTTSEGKVFKTALDGQNLLL